MERTNAMKRLPKREPVPVTPEPSEGDEMIQAETSYDHAWMDYLNDIIAERGAR